MKNTILYGLSGAEKGYTVLRYYCIDSEEVSTKSIQCGCFHIRMKNPDVENIYMIDNRPGLRREYRESIKKNTIESHFVFRDILEREGILLHI